MGWDRPQYAGLKWGGLLDGSWEMFALGLKTVARGRVIFGFNGCIVRRWDGFVSG